MSRNVQNLHVPFRGGVDLITPATSLDPGAALLAINYECPIEGGYRSVAGYLALGSVPGQGPILGVAVWKGEPYAIRQINPGSTANLYRWTGASTWVEAGTELPVGRYEFAIGNLFATAASEALYMVCPNGKPFEWDGTTFAQLTGAQSGASYIRVHKNHLFLGFEAGSLQHSALGDPTDWTTDSGAGEIGAQDQISGLALAPGGVLVMFGRDSIQALYGSSSEDWELRSLSANTGARAYTVAEMRQPIFINERGVTNLEATEVFGDFIQSDLTRQVQPLFSNDYRPVCACVSKERSQYMVWDDTGRGLRVTISGNQVLGVTTTEFPHVPTTCAVGETIGGDEVAVFGDAAGNVFRLDQGTSFNGAAIESTLVTAFNHCGSPTARKRFRRVFLESVGADSVDLTVLPSFDYDDWQIARHFRSAETLAAGGRWGFSDWDGFVWDGPYQSETPISISGTAVNINLSFHHSSAVNAPHTIRGYTLHYTPRRLRRG